MQISGLDWQDLIDNGLPPVEAMLRFAKWVKGFYQDGSTPIFVAFNAPFDWMFVNDYFHRYIGYNPFGHTALDMKALYMGLHRVSWEETKMQYVSNQYLDAQNLSHHALQDALDQAKIFGKLLAEYNNQGDRNG
jgi:DNA polymerase III alpha subunit (gram-positive type)